jgi:hypothetical protein
MTSISFTLTNILQYISFSAPVLITFFMISISIFTNKIIKGIIFTMGVIIITFVNYILKNTLKEPQNFLASPFCNILPDPFTVKKDSHVYSSPSLSSTILGYTAAYLIYPMKINNALNPSLIVFLISLLGINATVEYQNACSTVGGIFLGAIVGMAFGITYYHIISINNPDLAYFNEELSNNTQCSKASTKQFKCKVNPNIS